MFAVYVGTGLQNTTYSTKNKAGIHIYLLHGSVSQKHRVPLTQCQLHCRPVIQQCESLLRVSRQRVPSAQATPRTNSIKLLLNFSDAFLAVYDNKSRHCVGRFVK